jgi:hypothetical protein
MNAPSRPTDAGMSPLDSMNPSSEHTSKAHIRHFPLVPIGGWRWVGKKRESFWEDSPQAGPPRPVLAVSRPRRMRRCARTVLLWALLWYVVVQLFPLFLKDRWQYVATANETRKWPALHRLVTEEPDRPLLLMLGSSRACWAFRAGDLDGMPDSDGRPLRVFNFGIPATGPIHQLFYLRDLLAEGIRPRFVLIEVLPPLLCEAQRGALTEEGMTGFEWLTVQRLRQWMPYLRRPERRVHTWIQARIAPWYAFRRQLQFEWQCWAAGKPLPHYDPVDDWGWHIAAPGPCPPAERAQRLETARGGYVPGLSRFRLGNIPTKAFRELLDLCRQENIPAALIVMPESSEFRSWYSEDGKAAIHGLINELSQTYDLPLIDATCWLADEDFEDGHHALLHGAEVFTNRLQAVLPRLLAQSQAVKTD